MRATQGAGKDLPLVKAADAAKKRGRPHGGEDGPDRLVCPGGRLERTCVLANYIFSIADWTDDVLHKRVPFFIPHD